MDKLDKLTIGVAIFSIFYFGGHVFAGYYGEMPTPVNSSIEVKETLNKNRQHSADQYFVQRALNFEPTTGEFVQQTKLNRWSRTQWTNNNYHDRTVQKTGRFWQGQLATIELN